MVTQREGVGTQEEPEGKLSFYSLREFTELAFPSRLPKHHGVSLTRPVSGIGNDKVEVSHGHAPRRMELITRLRARQMEAPEEASCAGSLVKSGRWEAAFAVIRLLRGHTRLIQEAGAINLVTSWIHL